MEITPDNLTKKSGEKVGKFGGLLVDFLGKPCTPFGPLAGTPVSLKAAFPNSFPAVLQ